MRWVCFKDHYAPTASGFDSVPRPRECGTFGQWMLCQILWHGPEPLKAWLMRTGFVDAEHEGADAFWRWDFWNSKMRAEWLRIERQQWERKRSEAIQRWGEGAG
jgi:hypothetical protein